MVLAGKPQEVDPAWSRLEKTGFRVFVVPSSATNEPAPALVGAFVVVADPASKTFLWVFERISLAPDAKPYSAVELGKLFGERLGALTRTSNGFFLFCGGYGTGFTMSASKVKYTDESQIAELVLRGFNAPGVRPERGRCGGYIDGHVELHHLLGDPFFYQFGSVTPPWTKVESATPMNDGGWEVVVSSGIKKVAHITLTRDFSVLTYLIADP
jgi:hypothetical protein